MLALDDPRAGWQGRAVDLLHLEETQARHAAHYVDYRVEAAKLVEAGGVYGRPVSGRLGLRKPPQHVTRARGDGGLQRGAVDHPLEVGPPKSARRAFVQLGRDQRPGNSAPLCAPRREAEASNPDLLDLSL